MIVGVCWGQTAYLIGRRRGSRRRDSAPSTLFISSSPMENGTDGRCLHNTCGYMYIFVSVCQTALVHHSLWRPWLCLVSSFPSGALLPCQRMMSYLLYIETGTGDSHTPSIAFNVPSGHQWTQGTVNGLCHKRGKHWGLGGLTIHR